MVGGHHQSNGGELGQTQADSVERKWQPTLYSCLEDPVDRGAWWAAVHGVGTESDTTAAT